MKLVRARQVVAIQAHDLAGHGCPFRRDSDVTRGPPPRGACSAVFEYEAIGAAGIYMAVGNTAAFTLASGFLPCL